MAVTARTHRLRGGPSDGQEVTVTGSPAAIQTMEPPSRPSVLDFADGSWVPLGLPPVHDYVLRRAAGRFPHPCIRGLALHVLADGYVHSDVPLTDQGAARVLAATRSADLTHAEVVPVWPEVYREQERAEAAGLAGAPAPSWWWAYAAGDAAR